MHSISLLTCTHIHTINIAGCEFVLAVCSSIFPHYIVQVLRGCAAAQVFGGGVSDVR